MNRNFRRLIFAFLISISSLALTFFWYSTQKIDLKSSNQKKPVALLVSSKNEIQRKPTDRIIWQSLSNGDELYSAETIRTTDQAEASIKFLKSNTLIDLEPDSLIVIEEQSGQIGLNFIQGNIFVKATENTNQAIKLISGKNEIALKDAELSLGKNKGDQLTLEVLKGKAEVESGGKVLHLIQGKSGTISNNKLTSTKSNIEIISPNSGELIYVNPQKKQKSLFKFHPLSSDYTVYFETGESRSQLKPDPQLTFSGSSGHLYVPLKPGILYWRLTAKNQNGTSILQSSSFRNIVIANIPPTLTAPEEDAKIKLSNDTRETIFQWNNPGELTHLLLEVSTKPNLQNRISNTEVTGTTHRLTLEPGSYYWRMSGKPKNGNHIISSSISKFTIQSAQQVPAPNLIYPENLQKIPYTQIQEKGVEFSWSPISEATSYRLHIELVTTQRNPSNSNKQSINVQQTQYTFKNLLPGRYNWSVTAYSAASRSLPSDIYQFNITHTPTLKWSDNNTSFNYLTEKPIIQLGWEKGPQGTTTYLLKWGLQNENLSSKEGMMVNGNQVKIPLDKNGTYSFSVEGLNQEKSVTSQSSIKTLDVQPTPLLPAPEFDESLPNPILAKQNGSAHVNWKPVKGALEYLLIIKSENGSKKDQVRLKSTTKSFTNMLPGNHTLTLQAVDQHGRLSPESLGKTIQVPKSSNVKAPTIKKLEVN